MEMVADDEDNMNNNNNNNHHIFAEIDDEDWILEKPISVFALDPADRRVLKVADQRDAVQKKTFTKWINFHLSKREGLHIDDLFLDLRDGRILISLLEIFTNQTIPRERGTSKFHALQNIEQCLQCLEQDHNIRLVNIRPEELVNGNPKLTLGLIWRIILHFQFSDINLPTSDENIPIHIKQPIASIPTTEPISSSESKPVRISSISSTTQRKSSIDQISSNYRNMLLIWARQQCQGYPGIYIEDFTRSWRNGRAFLAILHRHNPQLININEVYQNSNEENLAQAFDFAQKRYGIMQLIDPEDVDTDEPDEKSILLYIAHLYKVCSTLPIHPFKQEHDRIHLQGELSYEYTNLASDLLKWIKIKLDFLNTEIKFKNLNDIETYENVLHVIRHDEMKKYNQILHRMRSIDAEYETLQLNEILQPDIESINLAWNKLEMTIDRVEFDLKQFLQQYEIIKNNFENDLDLFERDIANIERLIHIKSRQLDIVSTSNQLNDIQIKLDQILANSRTLPLPYEQIGSALERIDELNIRIDQLQTQLTPPPPSLKASSPTTTTTTNGFHQSSKRQARSNQPSSFFVNSPTGIEQLDVIVTGDYRRSGDYQQQQQTRSNMTTVDSGHSNNETKSYLLVNELHLINKNLNTLGQLLQQRMTRLLQTGLPTSNDDLLLLYQEHKDFENDLLSQASRIQDIRNIVRQEYNSSLHQELRSFINQTSDHVQDLFTTSKNYSEKLEIADTALSLVTDLTSHIIELETRLASHTPLIDDESYIHRQLDDLNELDNNLQTIEKSVNELLTQSRQLGNERLIRISEQLLSRWKQINLEINQRKRSITQCIETRRSFDALYQQEERILDNLQNRIETLEPIPTDTKKLQQMGKTVTDLFNEILTRAQSIEHMNDVAVKFIEETKMHDKNLKRFRVSLRDLHPSLDASVSITRRQYPTNGQRATRVILHKIEVFDKRYADLLAKMEDYTRAFVKNYNSTGQIINLPLDSASTIVHLYRSTIASRYNMTLQTLLSSDDDEKEQLSSSTKHNRSSNNKTGFIDLSRGKITVDHHHPQQQQQHNPSSLDGSVSFETTYVIPSTDSDLTNNKKVRFIVEQPSLNGNILTSTIKTNEMAQRKNLSFVDAVNSKHLDLSTGLFSSSSPFILSSSSSTFSSSTITSPDQHRHPHTHFSSPSASSLSPHTNITTADNKNLATSSVINHPHLPVGADSNTNSTTTITLKEAIDANILDAHSAYVVDTLEQRNYDLRAAYSRGLITSNDHHIVDRAKNQFLSLADALKMGILKVGDPQSYNIISKTESLVISSVYDHRLHTYIDPNSAIRKKILDPYHGSYLNNITQEVISIDDAMNKNLIIVQQQSSNSHANQQNDKYVISTSLIRETRSYHLLGVRDYINNREISVQEAIRLGILDKQNGQYIHNKTNDILSISEAIAQGHIRAQPLPVDSSLSSTATATTTNTQEKFGTSSSNVKRGTVKETKTYTLKSAIHPRTRKEIPIRQAIDEGIIDHAKGFYVNSLTGEQLPISVAIEKGLIFTELVDQHSRRGVRTLIIEQVVDSITNRRLGVTEAIQTGLLNSTITAYHHPVKQRLTILEAYEQGLILGKFVDHKPSSFIGDQHQQTYYLITSVTDIRTDKVYSLQDGIEQKLFDRRKGVYIHPITGDEISIGDAVKRGFLQVQAVSSQITDQTTSSSNRSNVSIHIESHPQPSCSSGSRVLQREKEIIEIESMPRASSRHRRHDHRTTEEEIFEQHTTNTVEKEVIIRGRSSERPKPKPKPIEEVVIDSRDNYRRDVVNIEEKETIIHERVTIDDIKPKPLPPRDQWSTNTTRIEEETRFIPPSRPQPPIPPPRPDNWHEEQQQQQSWSEEEWEQWHAIMMIKDKPYRVVWVMNTATGDRLPLQNAYQRGLVDTKQRLFFDEKLNRQSYSFEKAVELGYMGIEPDTASLPIRVDGIDYMIHWVLDSSTKRRIFPRQAIAKQILDATHGRYINPYNNSQVSLHEAIHLKFIGATEYGSTSDSINITIKGQTYNIKWVYDTVHMKKILPRDALRQGILDIQLNEYRKLDTNDVMTVLDAIQAGYIRCNDDDSSSDNSVRPPSIISVDEDELTIATKTATYVITSVIHPLTQKEIKVSEAIDLGILDKETGSYRDLVTNVQYELAEAINEGLVYATIIETKEDTEMMTSSLQEIVKKFIVKSVALDSESREKIGGLEAQAVGILNYAQGIYNDRKYGIKIPLDKAIERKLLDVELVSQKKFEEYDLELITDTITEKRITIYKIHGVQNNALGKMESGAIAVKNQIIDTENKTYTDFATGESMSIQEAVNRNLIQAEISEHVERKPLGLSMQNAIRLGFYVAETGIFRDPATEHYMSLMEAIERGHIHVNGVAFADSEQGPITLYDAFSLGLINRRDGGKLNPAKMSLYRAKLVESKLHRMNVEDAIRCGLLNLRTGLYKHPHSGEQLHLKEAIQRGLIDGQSTVIENSSTGRFMTLKDALDGIRVDNEGQVIDSYSNKIITTLELAFNHRKLFSQFDVNAGEIFLPSQNESIGFEKAVRKNLLDNNRIKLFDPKTSREYSIADAIERGLIDPESGLIYDSHSHTTYSIREAIRHGIIAIVGAPLVPIKADHETVAAKITSRNRRRHSLAKSSLHFDYNSAPESADEDSQGSGGWHRITSKNRAISPLSADGKRSIRRRTGSSPSRNNNNNNRFQCRDDDWRTGWKGGNDDDDDDNTFGNGGHGSRRTGGNAYYSSTTTTSVNRTQDNKNSSQGGRSSTGFQQKQEIFSPSSTVNAKETSTNSNKNDLQNSNELLQHKSEISFYVQPNIQVSNEPLSLSKIENISDDDELNSSITTESFSKKTQDNNEQLSQIDDNRVILDMHDVAGRLTSLHDQLNQYVYLTDNLEELQTNVQQIKTLHSDVEQEKSTIENLVERANNINPQLATLSQDLEEKRVEIANINSGLNDIIERFIKQVNHFNTEYDRLNKWIEINNHEIQKNLQLSNLDIDNDKLKTILNTTINLENDFKLLQEHLQSIDLTIQDFEQATGNTDGGKSANIYKQLQQRFDYLTNNYSDFLKRCKQISDQCERYLITYNEVEQLNEQIIKSINEFDQNLTANENKQENDNKLQILLLNVQQQLDKLGMLATYEPASPSPVMSSSNHIQNQIKEHLCTLLDSHTQRYNDAQQGLMHNFELIERYNHERQTVKERIDELNHWLLSYKQDSLNSEDFFSKPLSLKRLKLDEQIIQFRQFHAQLRTRRHSFDSNINTIINLEQLLDENDKNNIKLIDQQLQILDEQTQQYNDRINRLSTRLNEFHLEHSHLIDNYSKRLRLYSEHIEQNDDMNFSALQLLLNNDNESIIDHTLYEQLIYDLIHTDNIEDVNEINQLINQVNEYRNQYEKFQNDLKIILQNRHDILNKYEIEKNFISEWLFTTDRTLQKYPNELTISSCEQLLNEYINLPIEELKSLNQQLIQFYSSTNLLHLYEQLKLDKNLHKYSNTINNFQKQTDELIENYLLIKDKILQHMEILNKIQEQTNKYQLAKQKALNTIEKAKELVTLEENTILPLDNQQIEIMLKKYKDIADQFKIMSSTIDEYKTIGLSLINTAERYIDIEPTQNEIASIDKTWSEYIEYILDTIDYIQLHQEDLGEFEQISNNLINLLNDKQIQFDQMNNDELKIFNNQLEKYYEQIELLNQKGELLLQSSAININDNDNQIENLLEIINRNYDSLTIKTKVQLEKTEDIQQPTQTTTTTTTTEKEEIPSIITDKLADELYHHIEETNLAMNELSELLISSTTDIISAQPIKLNEQLLDNAAVQSELERRKIALDQLHSNVETLKTIMINSPDKDLIKILDDKLTLLTDHWLIMKQANDIRTENLLLTQTCAEKYWSQHNELSTILNHIEKDLVEIRPRSTSREYIEREKEKFNQLNNDFLNNEIKYKEILEQHSAQLLTLISNNPEESEDIQHSLHELEQEWNRIKLNLHNYQNEFEQAMIESAEFNSKLERVSTWFDDTSLNTSIETTNEFERIRTFKEHLDCKYLDIVNLKQDYTDIEQQKNDQIIKQDEHDKTNLVEKQLNNIDSKWTQLNEKIQEHKTLVYETALRQNRVGDVTSDITRSLDDCSSKLSVLINNSSTMNLNDMKSIEISIAKLRILLNDIELISYDIEQLKQNTLDDQQLIILINNQWEELLKQATEKYNYLEKKLEQMKLKQKLIDHIYHQLDLIDKQVNESTINTKFSILVEQLESIEEKINQEFFNENNQEIETLKKRLIDVKQRTLTKGQQLIELAHSIELFHSSLQNFTEWLTETERYLNNQKPVQRRFGLVQILLKQIDDHKLFQIQLQTYKEHLIDLDKLATHLKFVSPKSDSIYIRNSLVAAQTRWQKILTRTTERTKELQKAFQEAQKDIRPEVTDIDRIKNEVNRQASLCTCSKRYDVQQVAEGRYRFGESQSLRLVRILRSTVMVRVGGGWTALDEFLVRHDPCRGMHVYSRFLATVTAAKGRTNYELHPENYVLRDGVAQTMTLFKPRLVTVHRPTCLFHQQQLAAAGASKQSPATTPNRGIKEKSRRTSSIISLTTQRPPNSLSFGDLSVSGDDLSTSPHVLSDSEAKPSHIPIAVAPTTPITSTLSRTSSRESVLSEHSVASTSSTQQRRPSKLPLPVSRHKKATNGTTPTKNS